jgi:N-carbamoylputrescine amidase
VDASPVIDADGTLLGCPAMNQIAQFDGFWEEDYYKAGEGFEVFDTAAGLIGVVICFDRHFPESVREVARRGAEIVATPTCNEVGEPLDLFEAEMRTAGYQNHVFTLLANRCGTEEGRAYAGASLITGPDGGVLAKAGSGEAVVTADLDLHRRRALARERAWPQRALKAWG